MNTTIKTLAMAALAAFTFGFAPSAQADTVAKIIETGVTYDTVKDAIDDAEDGQTVQMLTDASGNVTITGKAITLDLAGKVLKSAAEGTSVITVNGGLTLVDSAPTATHTGEGFELLPPGGVITGARAKTSGLKKGFTGGGVNNSGTFTMLGGTIIDNQIGGIIVTPLGGGVYNNGTMTVGGTASIRGNLNAGAADNLYLPDGKTVSVGTGDAAPKAGMAIGISVATAIASGESLAVTGANAADYHTHFSSDNPAYYVINGENNAVALNHAPAARNVNTGVDYETFQAAVDAASDGDTIRLLRDASGNVTVTGKSITLDLNGKELSAYSDNVITLGDDNNAGTLTLIDGTAVAPETIGAGRITSAPGGTGARGVKVTKSGTFYLTSGRISGCCVIGEYGDPTAAGGGVYSEGTVIMTGGAIENCRTTNSGGGVRSWSSFTMSGGVIRGCSASAGGGILASETTLNLGGTAVITNNSASLEGGGVYYSPSLTLSGSVTITDNTNSTSGSADNLFACKRLLEQPGCYPFAVADGFDGTIGVTTEVKPTKEELVTFATNVVSSAVAKRFFSDDAQYAVFHTDGNELQLVVPDPVTPVEYVAPVYRTEGDPKSGIDHWVTNSVSAYTVVTDQTTWGAAGETSWYVVAGDTTIESRITCVGQVNLILKDGATLNAEAGITASTGSEETSIDYLGFTVYAQSEGATMGALVATDKIYRSCAAIGGYTHGEEDSASGENITINGGKVTVTGGTTGDDGAAGIGGTIFGNGTGITINGGIVTSTGGDGAAGIGGGGGGSASDITVNGGTVTAIGLYGAGIGSGTSAENDTANITINGGTVFVCGAVARVEDEEGGYTDYYPDLIGNGIASESSVSGVVIAPAAKVFFNLTGIKKYQTENWIEPILPMPESFEGYTIMTPETAVTRVLVSGMSALPGGQPLLFALTNAATEVTGTITVNDEKGVQFANKLLKLPYADSKLTLTAENPPPVATVKIGTGEAVEYTTIEEAWTAACEGTAGKAAVLTLLKDVTTTSTLQATRGSSGDPTVMTLDLNGCVLKAQQPADPTSAPMFNVIDNAGTLTVKDSKFGDTTIPHYFEQTKLFGQYDIWTLTDTPNENVVYGGLITGGAQLDGGEGDVNGGAINNYSAGGSLTIVSGNIAGNFVIGAMADGGAIASGDAGATFLMTGGEVCYNSSSVSGGGIIVYEDSGTAEIQGGKIHHNLSASCAGVAASGTATLTISGGEIYGNRAIANGVQGSGSGGGAGVTRNTATLIVEGGKIYDNTADGIGGGGILNNLGTVTITGGEIYGNIAQSESGETSGLGGGVANTGTLTISGGAIYGNSASTGGGGVASVTMSKSPATVTMTGGAITNNSGVAVLNMGAMTLGGTAVIAGDPEHGAPGLYLPIGPSGENYLVTISSETPFTTGAAIGVTTAADPGSGSDVQITTNGAAGDVDYFTSDRGHFVIFKDGALYLSVNPPTPTGIQVGDDAWAELVDGVCTIRGTGATWDGSAKNPFDKDSITNVVIASGITGVGKYFFKFCTRLNTVTGGPDLVAVGTNTFFGCFSLETITLDCNMPEGLDKAVVYQDAIDPDTGTTYQIPSIKVKNYVTMLYGKKNLSDEWECLGPSAGKSIYDQGDYRFFQTKLEKEEGNKE